MSWNFTGRMLLQIEPMAHVLNRVRMDGELIAHSNSGSVSFSALSVQQAAESLRLVVMSGVFDGHSPHFQVVSETAHATSFTRLPASGAQVGKLLAVQPQVCNVYMPY